MTTETEYRALLEQALEALTCNLHPTWIGLPQTVEAIRAELAKPTPTPTWHDAPTEPGLWLNSTSSRVLRLENNHDAWWGFSNGITRWYGPIPQDAAKAEGSTV